MSLLDLLPAALWTGPFFFLPRLTDRRPSLRDYQPSSSGTVSVIIPARNEEATIETVLRSILRTEHPDIDVLVVDDRSEDRTAELAAAFAETDDRVQLIQGEKLPAGWYGKPWACYQGYRRARGEYLLFTDADTKHQPKLIPLALGAREGAAADLLTVSPHQRCDGFWERVVMPQVWALLGVQYHPKTVNKAETARWAIANGQFVLMSRESYEAVGTHRVVRSEVAEDLALAQETVRKGRKLFFVFGTDEMETRMYRSLGQLVEGWSKNLFLGGRKALSDHPIQRAFLPVSFLMIGAFWLAPIAALVLGAFTPGSAVLPGAALAVLFSATFWAIVSHSMRIPPRYGLLYPLGVVMLLWITGRSVWRGSRRVVWRGRTYGPELSRGTDGEETEPVDGSK